MARKSAAASTGDDFADLIADAIGGNDEKQEVKVWLDTGFPPLNHAISADYKGGLPCGRMVEMFGPPSSGKTAIATEAMIAAQKMGGVAMFLDHENSFDVGLAEANGLSTEFPFWIYKKPDTFEESMDFIRKLGRAIREGKKIPEEAPIVVVMDSLASMVPYDVLYGDKGQERDATDRNMRDKLALAAATSAHFPAITKLAEKYNMLLLVLNQMREKPGVSYGDNTTTPGGKAPEFYSSVRIQLSRAMLKDKATNEVLGQVITANCVKNKVSRPFQKASWRFMFREDGTGHFDVTFSVLEYLKVKGRLQTDGNYIVWDGKKYYLGQLAKMIDEEGRQAEVLALLDPTPAAPVS